MFFLFFLFPFFSVARHLAAFSVLSLSLSLSLDVLVLLTNEKIKKQKTQELTICYLRHAFGLGEHYNSTVVAAAKEEERGGGGGGSDEDGSEEDG